MPADNILPVHQPRRGPMLLEMWAELVAAGQIHPASPVFLSPHHCSHLVAPTAPYSAARRSSHLHTHTTAVFIIAIIIVCVLPISLSLRGLGAQALISVSSSPLAALWSCSAKETGCGRVTVFVFTSKLTVFSITPTVRPYRVCSECSICDPPHVFRYRP